MIYPFLYFKIVLFLLVLPPFLGYLVLKASWKKRNETRSRKHHHYSVATFPRLCNESAAVCITRKELLLECSVTTSS